jgi:hypothetical protein
MWALLIIVLIIGAIIFVRRRDKKDETNKNLFPPQGKEYTKRLEAYMQQTRNALLIYEGSNRDPQMAILTLEIMKVELAKVATIFLQPTEKEHDAIFETLKKLGKIAHTAYHKGI